MGQGHSWQREQPRQGRTVVREQGPRGLSLRRRWVPEGGLCRLRTWGAPSLGRSRGEQSLGAGAEEVTLGMGEAQQGTPLLNPWCFPPWRGSFASVTPLVSFCHVVS